MVNDKGWMYICAGAWLKCGGGVRKMHKHRVAVTKGRKYKYLKKSFDFLRTTVFDLLSQTKGNAVNCFVSFFR